LDNRGKAFVRKYALLLIMTITLTPALFGQYFDYVSLGYNTVTKTDQNGDLMGRKEYFLNDDRFSKMQIDINFSSYSVFMEKKEKINIFGKTYDGVVVGGLWSNNFDYFEEKEGYYGINLEIYRVENGKLVYVKDGGYISDKIEYSDKGIKVTMREETVKHKGFYYLNFYNIPETELYDKFMKGLVYAMKESLKNLDMSERRERYYDDKLKNLTRMELELFKNCMLAKYSYSFQDPMWIDFMKKYNYYTNGSSSFFQAVKKFSISERNLLELIQKELADKYFVIGDYYLTQDNLRLRDRASLSGNVLTVISAYDWVKILEEGKEETIDDITSAWVKVKLLNNKEGWCFGGYLGY
jgi:hypothetical protein